MFLDSEPEALYQPLVIPLRGSHTDAKLFHPDDAEKELVPEFFAVGPMAMSIRMRFTQGRRPESGNPIYKCNSPTQGAEAPKYLTIGLLTGFIVGGCIGVLAWAFLQNLFAISICAGIGMLIGIVIGTLIDYEKNNHQEK